MYVKLKIPLTFILPLWMLLAHSSNATNLYIATTGSDSNDCLAPITACLTLQHVVDISSTGDTINIATGTYAVAGLVTVNKTLTILGAQAGVDARTRIAAETVLSNTQGISVSANNVVFDGFTIQDSSNSAFTGYGIWINPGINGTQIINNIFQNNIVGLGLSNGGASQCLVQHNLFKDNNLPGGSSGTGIYTDQYEGQQVTNVLINENTFENNDNAGIGISNDDITRPDSLITITNNLINNCGRGIYLLNTMMSTISGNTISNLTAPTDGGNSVGIGIYGGVTGLTVTDNDLTTGVKYGIRIATLIPGSPAPANTDLQIHLNNITGFAVAGLQVDNAPTSPVDYATCNWWGSDTGPTSQTLNPTGTGDVVAGDVIVSNFNPWLLSAAPDGSCGEMPSVAKSFSPATVYRGEPSVITITLSNPNNTPANLTAPFSDIFPRALNVIGNATTTCGGTVTAKKGSSKVTLTGGSIPANGSCTIKVKVQSCIRGTYTNIIPVGALVTDKGNNADPAQATLTVLCNFRTTSTPDEEMKACYPY